MPYFRSGDGRGTGHVNDEATMAKLEEYGYIRLEGIELFTHIVWIALRKIGIPAVCALIAHYYSNEFMVGLVVYIGVRELLD